MYLESWFKIKFLLYIRFRRSQMDMGVFCIYWICDVLVWVVFCFSRKHLILIPPNVKSVSLTKNSTCPLNLDFKSNWWIDIKLKFSQIWYSVEELYVGKFCVWFSDLDKIENWFARLVEKCRQLKNWWTPV